MYMKIKSYTYLQAMRRIAKLLFPETNTWCRGDNELAIVLMTCKYVFYYTEENLICRRCIFHDDKQMSIIEP